MKPIKLTMQAFSAYLDETVIDFRPLNEQGLYLIAGDTGAGKTTIFDAISYALYGETSGSNRSKDVFRSQFASYDIPTVVRLEFELNHKMYTVERSVSYRKSGTARPGNDILNEPDGSMTTGRKKVNDRLKDLLGVDARQFKQIVMIAQGEFTRLLNASSKDKEKIFRDIFNTGYLNDLEKNIMQKSKEIAQQCADAQLKLDTMLKSLDVEKETYDDETIDYLNDLLKKNAEDLNVMKKERDEREAKVRSLEASYHRHVTRNERIDDYHRYQDEKKQLLTEKDHYQALKNTIELLEKMKEVSVKERDVQRLSRQRDDLLKTAEDIARRQEELKKKLSTWSDQEKKREAIEKRISELNVQREYCLKLSKAQKEFHALADQCQKEEEDLADVIHHISRQNKKITEKQSEMKAHAEKIAQKPALAAERKSLADKYQKVLEKIRKMHELSDCFDQYNQAMDDYLEANDQQEKAQKKLAEDEKLLADGRQLFLDNQAGYLASHLKEGEACPVCGSIHHPHLAVNKASRWTAQVLEKMTEDLKKEQTAFAEKQAEIDEKKALCDKRHLKMESLRVGLGLEESLSRDHFVQILGEITAQEKQMEKENDDLESEIAFCDELADSQSQNEALIRKMTDQLDDLEKKQKALQADIDRLKGSMQAMKKEYPDLTEKSDRLGKIEKQLQSETENREAILQEKNQLTAEKSRLSALADESEKNQKQTQASYQQAIVIFKEALSKIDLSEDEYKNRKADISSLDEKRKEYNDYQDQLMSVNGSLKALSDVADEKKTDTQQEKEQLDQIRAEHDEKNNAYAAALTRYQSMKKTAARIKKLADDNGELMAKNQRYHHLSEVINGNNAAKMTFESYVLAAYFNHVLEYANIELQRLTEGRYEFVRRQETSGNGRQGLDLDINDYETGMTRDVKSLSGGESFKASLALALGLSSMIQSMAGGIELNALFIDEGFGTLDQESLDSAINVLLDMKSDRKVIGIISHVSELENRIDAKIRVQKGPHGSHLKVEV